MSHLPQLVVMGVSGSGKSTVGAALAQRLGVPFADADDLHPAANVAKMSRGEPLDDDDRRPWLATIGRWLEEHPDGGVVSCSALKRSYRDQLREHAPDLELLHLQGAWEVIARRQASRPGHFMPASLLSSQFATLEPLQPDEKGLVVDVDQSVDAIVQQYVDRRHDATGHTHEEGALMTALTALLPLAASPLVDPVAPGWQLVLAALASIAVIVVLITVLKVHPFLSLVFGALTVGVLAGRNVMANADGTGVLPSFMSGFGSTAAGVGILIVLGAMFAKLLADSGGADQIVDTIVGKASPRALPWAMALVGAIIGLPMFFEIGLVLLMPVIYLVARRAQVSLITVGIPALAGLSAMHGFVPPHPGPVTAIGYLGADLGTTLALGLLVAVPTVIVGGPLFGRIAGRWVDIPAPHTFDADLGTRADGPGAVTAALNVRRPTFPVTLATVLLPVVLMLGKALVDVFVDDETQTVRRVFDLVGEPFFALLIALVVAMFTLGRGSGMDARRVAQVTGESLPAIAGILLIVAAGGGFKQSLVDTGIGTLLAEWADGANISVLLLAWVLAVLIRLATGSATVATITASSLMIGLVEGMSSGETSLVVLAVGAGSVFFSHVNDAGFWLVKEYFGMSVGQTVKTWSIMETVLSVTGLVVVLALGIVI